MEDNMETLVEYLTYVKGTGYVLVVAFLFAFITFWMLVHSKNKDLIKGVPLIVMIWLAFCAVSAFISTGHNANGQNVTETEAESAVTESAFPEFYSNGSPATITSHRPEKWLGVNETEYLSVSLGSATYF